MKNKNFALALLVAIFSALIPNASAADIPFLSWERGKQQNIVLGVRRMVWCYQGDQCRKPVGIVLDFLIARMIRWNHLILLQ